MIEFDELDLQGKALIESFKLSINNDRNPKVIAERVSDFILTQIIDDAHMTKVFKKWITPDIRWQKKYGQIFALIDRLEIEGVEWPEITDRVNEFVDSKCNEDPTNILVYRKWVENVPFLRNNYYSIIEFGFLD